MKISLEKKLVVSFGVAVAMLLLIALVTAWNAVRFDGTLQMVDHTYEVLGNLSESHLSLLRMQSNVRGFLITGREEMLTAYHESDGTLSLSVKNLRHLVPDNPGQISRLASLEAAVARAKRVWDELIDLRRTGDFDPARAAPVVTRSQAEMREVRILIVTMEGEEHRLLTERVAASRSAERATIATAAVAGLIAIGLVLGAGLIVRRDYRARIAAESALRVSEENLRQTLESISDYAIIRIDPAGRILSWNPGAEKIIGYPAEEILGQSIERFYPAEAVQQGRVERELREAAATGRFEEEDWRVRRDGTRFWANVILSAIRDHDGRQIGFVKVTRDLSIRRKAEEQIQSLNRDLQRQNARLEHANAELESFSYSVSHDLRAPLRHIDGFASLLTQHAQASLDEKGRRFLTVISESARRMGRLIDDLLSFSRMGRTQMEFVELDHAHLVAGVIREGGYDRDPKIEWRISPLPRVRGDAAMLRQVWLNLIDNAVKYSSRTAAPRIEIGGKPVPEKHERIFHIRDNGVGFEMKYADRLFGVFQRLHAQSDFEGTGIGLANVRRIVLRHGGRVWAESTPGSGTTFSFSLPDDHDGVRLADPPTV